MGARVQTCATWVCVDCCSRVRITVPPPGQVAELPSNVREFEQMRAVGVAFIPTDGYLDAIEDDDEMDDTMKWRAFAAAWGWRRRRCSDTREDMDKELRRLYSSKPGEA